MREYFGETPISLVFRGQSDENLSLNSSAERRLKKKSSREFKALRRLGVGKDLTVQTAGSSSPIYYGRYDVKWATVTIGLNRR